MRTIDVADNSELSVLVDMLREVSTVHDPVAMLRKFGRHFWKVRPLDVLISLSTRDLPAGQYKITRMLRPGELGPDGSSSDPWRDWARMPAHSGGFLGDLIATPHPKLLHELAVRADPVLGDQIADMGACMASPLFDRGEALNWNLYLHSNPTLYTPDNLADHFLTANLVGTATRNLIAVNRAEELNTRLVAQLEAVARVQKALLPTKTPDIPGLTIATSYLTSNEAGGDYYDFFELPGGKWGILIADVSGHGAAAATVMAMLHAILHGYQGPEFSPAAVMTYANRRLASSRIESTFVTAFFAVYDPPTGLLEYARAGHNPPRIKQGGSGGVGELADAGGLPLGITDQFQQQTGSITLEVGDTLVLYTDGITEAFDAQREQFGLKRLDGALVDCSGEPECVVDSVHKALFKHTRSMARDDDQTIVALRRKA